MRRVGRRCADKTANRRRMGAPAVERTARAHLGVPHRRRGHTFDVRLPYGESTYALTVFSPVSIDPDHGVVTVARRYSGRLKRLA